MMLRRARGALFVGSAIAVLACAACGGGPPSAVPAPPPAHAKTKHEEAPADAPAAPEKTAADHHREFMGACAKKAASSPDYCECAWGELRKTFTDDEMSTGEMSPVKLDKFKGQVIGACASKIPEDAVRAEFANACVSTKPELKPYCECTWTEFRKRFSTAELNDEATVSSQRFLAARGPVVKTCAAKMPESVSKEAFMKGCMKDASVDKFCGCAWKELRKAASPAEIEAGTFDQKTIFGQVEKTCAKHRPPKP